MAARLSEQERCAVYSYYGPIWAFKSTVEALPLKGDYIAVRITANADMPPQGLFRVAMHLAETVVPTTCGMSIGIDYTLEDAYINVHLLACDAAQQVPITPAQQEQENDREEERPCPA